MKESKLCLQGSKQAIMQILFDPDHSLPSRSVYLLLHLLVVHCCCYSTAGISAKYQCGTLSRQKVTALATCWRCNPHAPKWHGSGMLPCNKRRFLDTSIKCYLETLILSLVPATWKLLGSKWEHMHGNGIFLVKVGWISGISKHFWHLCFSILPRGIAGHKVPQLLQCFSLREIGARTWDTHWKQNASKGCTWARTKWPIEWPFSFFLYLFLVWLCVFALVSFPCLKFHSRWRFHFGILLRVTAKGEATCFAEFPKQCVRQ